MILFLKKKRKYKNIEIDLILDVNKTKKTSIAYLGVKMACKAASKGSTCVNFI